jgi:Ca-activated chloride channel family protein
MRRHRHLIFLLACIGCAVVLGVAGASPARASADKQTRKEQKEALKKLPQQYRDWLEVVDLLITNQERAAFLALDKDYQRDAFISRFWEVREHGAGRDFQRQWEARIEEARARFHGLLDERARVFLLNGPPGAVVVAHCATLLWPVEGWYYRHGERYAGEFVVVFYQRWGAGPFRIWEPMDGLGALFVDGNNRHSLSELAGSCRDGDTLAGMIGWVGGQGLGYGMLEARFESKPEGPGGEWVSSFHSYSTDVPADAVQLAAKIDYAYPGREGGRTAVQGVISVRAGSAGLLRLGDHVSYDLLVTGEVLEGNHLFENFRYKFVLPGNVGADAELPLVFQRLLRPGDYTLIVKVEDLNSPKIFRAERRLAVPRVDQALPPSMPGDPETARLLAESNATASRGDNTIKLIAPYGELQTGMLRFDTVITGKDVDHVTFALDGKQVFTKRRPPFSVEFDMGRLPRPRTLAATAFDAAGNQLASDQLLVNASPHRFRIRLTEPQRGKRYESSLLAKAETDAPEDETIDRVEIYLNESLVATLFQPPYTQPIVLPKESVAYVRAVAYTTDGNSTEDIVFINSPDNVEQLNVQFVELYTSALDRQGRPVQGLSQKDFSVREDGTRQEIVRFDQVTNLPVHAAIVLDTSASMEKALDTSREAALRFLQDAIKPKDRAAVITFNDHPNIGVKFSNDLTALAGGLAGLKAERGTALYDTIIFSLFYFNGVKGQRAILLLSDGKDEGSRFSFEDCLDYARRAGVTIYSIGLGDQLDKKKLSRISEDTGGRAFFIKNVGELAAIYATVEEDLRSQYLIAYQSTNTSTDGAFRSVEVKVSRSGVEAKTLRGYYP